MTVSPSRVLAAAVLLVAGVLPAWSADYPTKPIKIVVPYSPGGSTDALARILAERLGKRLGQTVIVENKPGASEQIAITSVTKAAPDGYTLLLSTLSGLAVNPGLYGPRLQYNPQKDLVPIVLARLADMSLDVVGGAPAKVTDLIKSDSAKWKKVIDDAGIKVD